MFLQEYKTKIDQYDKNNIILKEDPTLVITVSAIIFFYLFVIPIMSLVWINYVVSIFKFRRPKYNEELTKEIRSITNFNVDVYTVDIPEKNAYHAGTKRIFITNGLMQMLTHKEIIAILLHECGHYANSDVKKNIFLVNPICNILVLFAMAGILSITIINGVPGDEIYLLFKVHDLFQFVKNILLNLTIGRRAEYLADSFASECGYKSEILSALNKLELWVRGQVCGQSDTKFCDVKMKRLHMFDEHPEFWKRKINIESEDLKYTKKVLKDFNFINVKRSYFELRQVWKKLNKEFKEFEKNKKLEKKVNK